MSTHSSLGQINFVTQWFGTWSEFQKEDFLIVISQKLSPKETTTVKITVNGMSNGNGYSKSSSFPLGLDDSGRPPSLFACQLKLFNEWWDNNWNEDDRTKLTTNIKESDGKFWNEVESEVNGTRVKVEEEFYAMLARDALETAAFAQNKAKAEDTDDVELNGNATSMNTNEVDENAKELNGIDIGESLESDPIIENINEGVTTIHISGNEPSQEVDGEQELKEDN